MTITAIINRTHTIGRMKWWLGFGSKFLISHLVDSVCSESFDSRHHGFLKTYRQNSDGSYRAVKL